MSKLKIISEEKDTEEMVKTAILAEIKRLEVALRRTEREIRKFEEEYRVPSEAFLRDFAAENLKGGDEDYVKWAGELQMRERIREDLRKLKDIEYVSH
ncbi:MAG: hypothetical protein M1508_05175 [Nitrospirae bacterium]|nr:hypothetical protein [Nitrospirota bacterium]MCL5422447.1 hypothetical protein [Nitrospirota bacterium]